MREDIRQHFEGLRWRGPSRSGLGSTMEMTERLRTALPIVFSTYGIKSFADIPCGDWFWMQHVDLTGIDYVGGDISLELVEENAAKFADREGIRFSHIDITSDPLPDVDMMMCRDCLFHLPFEMCWDFLRSFVASDIRYLMATTHHVQNNTDLARPGQYRHLNLCAAPFNLAPPITYIHETCETLPADPEQQIQHRSLGIWTADQLQAAVAAKL
ncbi:class I SAM-dependent methyltransferase [Halovulum sp. GXIMD14793]